MFQTGDGEGFPQILTLFVPDAEWFKRALIEALFLMAASENWAQYGDVTPERAAELAIDMIDSQEWFF